MTQPLKGTGADFGCGYGYLSREIAEAENGIKKLYAIDADYHALACCRKNLKPCEDKMSIEYLWADLNKKPFEISNLDWVIMNPPFHDGKKTDIAAGQNFIQSAAASLRKGGRLYMVANAHLPYENILRREFSDMEKIIEKQGFKVIFAEK
jgi:16S rRNA (guanine1207-N2)-methyltransferase